MNPETKNLDALRIDRSEGRQTRWGLWVILLIVILAAAGASVLWIRRSAALSVRTVPVEEAAIGGKGRTILNASGYVTARRRATVSSKVTGKVIEVFVEEGMKVAEGQVLARLDRSNVSAVLDLAEAQLKSAESGLEETRVRIREADLTLGRTRKLVAEKVASQADLDAAEAEADSLRARLLRQAEDVKVAARQVALSRQDLEDTVIRAPFSGVVTSKNAQPGEMISPISAGGGFTRTGICTIVDMSSLEVEVDVNESYINRVAAGQPVEAVLDSYPDWKIPSKVIAIIPSADREKATVKIRIGFEGLDPKILPDMGVKVAFRETEEPKEGARASVLQIPRSALRSEKGQDIVFIVSNGKVERRAVRVGVSENEKATIDSGLHEGEKVVVEGPADLADGARV